MIRKLALAVILVLVVAIGMAGFSAQAGTCRRATITILDEPYRTPTICTPLEQAR